jgi:hypothetical protein
MFATTAHSTRTGAPDAGPGGRPIAGWSAVGIGVLTTAALAFSAVGQAQARPIEPHPAQANAASEVAAVSLDSRPAGAEYVACMRALGGSADRLEHWVGTCRHGRPVAALAQRAYVECLRTTPGTADGLDRRVAACHALTDGR